MVNYKERFEKQVLFYNKIRNTEAFLSLKNILLFIVIIVSFHFLWSIWDTFWGLKVFGLDPFLDANILLIDTISKSTAWVLNILNIPSYAENGIVWISDRYTFLTISKGCTGLKQFFVVFVLLLLTPGPWKHKIWFIPIAILIMHITNVSKMVVLSLILLYNYDFFTFAHDNLSRVLFYTVMFFIWVIWVEKITYNKSKEKTNKPYPHP